MNFKMNTNLLFLDQIIYSPSVALFKYIFTDFRIIYVIFNYFSEMLIKFAEVKQN